MNKKIFLFAFIALIHLGMGASPLNFEKLSANDQKIVDSLLQKTRPLIEEKEAHANANLLTFEELEKSLSKKEKNFIKKILLLTPADLGVRTPKQTEENESLRFHEIKGQVIQKDGKPFTLPPQAISPEAYAAYEKMMGHMEKDLGKRLYIESGHRARAYHLYNFLKYLAQHQYSLIETAKLNALPGYSEHNLTRGHAIDFISAEGINGDPRPEDYEVLPEHAWMLKHAGEYGFTLSYPRNNPSGISFEPWHWRYQVSSSDSPALVTRPE